MPVSGTGGKWSKLGGLCQAEPTYDLTSLEWFWQGKEAESTEETPSFCEQPGHSTVWTSSGFLHQNAFTTAIQL